MKNGMHICNESVFISLARWPKLTFTRAVKGIRQYLSKMAEKSFPSCCSHFPTIFFLSLMTRILIQATTASQDTIKFTPSHLKIYTQKITFASS